MSAAVIKCDPSRLPVPRLEPTRAYHTKEKPDVPLSDGPPKTVTTKKATNGWTEDQQDILVAMYHRGCGYSEIAEKVGRSPQACQAKITRLGEAKKTRKENFKWTGDRVSELLTLLRNGLSKKEAAARMGVTDDQVYGTLRRLRRKS